MNIIEVVTRSKQNVLLPSHLAAPDPCPLPFKRRHVLAFNLLILAALLIAAFATTGCAVFGTVTPTHNARISRAGTDGKGELHDVDTLILDGKWLEENVSLTLREEFYDPATIGPEGASSDFLKSREITIVRKSGTEGATEVSNERARATARMSADFFDLVAAAAPHVTQTLTEINQIKQENRTLRELSGHDRDVELGRINQHNAEQHHQE